ncbi:MAG: alpha/beta hydrolase-fold protein [Bacteroidota bacterium]
MTESITSKMTLIMVAACLFLTQMALSQDSHSTFRRTIDSTVVAGTNYTVDYFRLYSPSMQREIKILVATPPSYKKNPQKEFPVLYTLHGANSPYDTWHHLLRLQDNIKDKPFIYTCFDGDAASNYIDSYYPLSTSRDRSDTTQQLSLFKTFFFDEFMPVLDQWYRIDATKRGITGYSMGGQGALNYMLVAPDKFTAISSLSTTVLDFSDGSGFAYSRKLDKFLRDLGYDVRFIESEGGHNWDFWLKTAGDVIEYHWTHFNE